MTTVHHDLSKHIKIILNILLFSAATISQFSLSMENVFLNAFGGADPVLLEKRSRVEIRISFQLNNSNYITSIVFSAQNFHFVLESQYLSFLL